MTAAAARRNRAEEASPGLVRETSERICDAEPRIARRLLQQFPSVDLPAALQAVRVPVRCINSSKYATNVEANRRYADFAAVRMEGAGHFPMLELPDEFNRLLASTLATMLEEEAAP